MPPVLVDSSLWVHQLRRSGNPALRDQVNSLLMAGRACWCPVVRLELWRGVTSDAERKALRAYESRLPDLPMTDDVWEAAIRLAERGRAAGVTVPLADLLIFACARTHGVELAHDDAHFDHLKSLRQET